MREKIRELGQHINNLFNTSDAEIVTLEDMNKKDAHDLKDFIDFHNYSFNNLRVAIFPILIR